MSDERATPAKTAAPPAGMPVHKALPFIGAAILLAITQGLGQGFVSVNLAQIAGDLGVSATDASWLMVAYMIPRASLPLLLIKIRAQFGLRRFAEIGMIAYLLVSFASLWTIDLRSAVVLQFLSGVASAPISTLAFLYFLEPLSPPWKMRLGLPMALAFLMVGTPFSRVLSPELLGDGGLVGVHLTVLGLAMVSLALVFRMPLQPTPHVKAIKPMDLVSFALTVAGFGGIIAAFILGPTYRWTNWAWIGWTLVGAVVALTLVVVIELHRKVPLLDIRWLASPAIVHLTGALFLFRLILSEQSAGAPRMFQVLGIAPAQMTTLFAVISLASILGGLACVAWIKPGREPTFHFVALALIALGAFMDAHATMDTRPAQMLISQALIGFASMLFMPPAMMAGLIAALAKGPSYLLSFVIVFLSTQSIGGIVGSGAFTTLINWRQALHLQVLAEQLQPTAPHVTTEILRRMTSLAPQISDVATRKAQAVSLIAQDAVNQAYVMAYNDAYFLTFLIAIGAACALVLHVVRDWLIRRLERWQEHRAFTAQTIAGK